MTTFYNSFSAADVINDPAAEAEQIEEYASQFVEPVQFGLKTKLKTISEIAGNALLMLSSFHVKGKAHWAYDGVADALTQVKNLSIEETVTKKLGGK